MSAPRKIREVARNAQGVAVTPRDDSLVDVVTDAVYHATVAHVANEMRRAQKRGTFTYIGPGYQSVFADYVERVCH